MNDTLHIEATRIAGTDIIDYSAWEPTEGNYFSATHSTIQCIDGVLMGRVGTNRLPAHLDALPARTTSRALAVSAFHQGLYYRAYVAILAQYPHLLDCERSRHDGIITEVLTEAPY